MSVHDGWVLGKNLNVGSLHCRMLDRRHAGLCPDLMKHLFVKRELNQLQFKQGSYVCQFSLSENHPGILRFNPGTLHLFGDVHWIGVTVLFSMPLPIRQAGTL